MFNRIIYFILISLLSICSAFSQINVVPITDTQLQINKSAVMYYLPQSTLEVKTTVTTKCVVPGPYAQYAEKYLSIKNVPIKITSKLYIDSVKVREIETPDPNACFVVTGQDKLNISYRSNGIISGYNVDCVPEIRIDDNEYFLKNNEFKVNSTDMLFTDYGVKRNFIGNTDTTYKVVEIDSVFQKIPVFNTTITSKDEESKAEEVANYIIKIRKRLFKILTAQFETDVPPTDISLMVDELKNLEKKYMELFIGKELVSSNEYLYYYTPKFDLKEDKIAILYASSDGKILTQQSENSEPIYLVLKNNETTKEINRFYTRQLSINDKEKSKGLYYRIPSSVDISVEYKDFTYYRNTLQIPQCGYLGHLPADLFKKNVEIVFDDKYGSVKSVSVK